MELARLRRFAYVLAAAVSTWWPAAALADDGLNRGDTAWVLTSTALVLFMTLPGLFLFYGGLLQRRNVLSVMVQCFALTATVTIVWLAFGYSLAFDTTGMQAGKLGAHAFVGGLHKAFLIGVTGSTLWGTIPEPLFFIYQLTFAIITPGLFLGAFAERMKFSAVMWFSLLWLVLVYLPICHMVWGGPGAYLADLGVKDYAGGIVVHITAGVAALVAAIMVGPRNGFPDRSFIPHNMTATMMGTAMLWVGWFGFNGGSGLAANGDAAMAIVATQVSAAGAAITWSAIEYRRQGKASALGIATGAVAGLAAVTPGAGFVGPVGALVIGVVSAGICFLASVPIKRRFGYDDSLDVFGVHGVGGMVGTLLLAPLASVRFGGRVADLSISTQLKAQLIGTFGTAAYSIVVSILLLKVLDATLGLRVTDQQEREGLDEAEHAEVGYEL
ncbi:MAG TPA: ammonium transporter [Polyangiales bacterium]